MADIEKLATTLDSINDRIKEFERSAKAAEKANEDIDSLKADLAQQKAQLQEVFEASKRIPTMPKSEREEARMIGETVVKCRKGVLKQQSEGTDADGGYLVADEFATAIRSTQNSYGAVRKIWGNQIIPMASDVLKVPVRTYGDTTGNQPEMQTISENAQISSDTGKVGQISLTASKYGTLVYVSRELVADAFVDYVGAYLRDQIAMEAAKKEDDLVFNTASTGLLSSTNIQTVTLDGGLVQFQDLTIEALRECQDAVTDEAWEMGGYFCHRSIRTMLRNLRANADEKGPFLWGDASAGVPPSLDGFDLQFVSKMPARAASAANTGFLLFGDLPKAMLVGQRGGAELATSADFRFDYDQIAVRYLFRFAYGTDANLGRAACKLKTATV